MNNSQDQTVLMKTIKSALISQLRASLMMLQKGVVTCSDDLWVTDQYSNRTWQLVYHALFFTDLYLYQHLDERKRFYLHKKDYQNLGEANSKDPYSKMEMAEYITYINDRIENAIDSLDLLGEDCGFYWYKVNKMEHQMVNLKHLQHHVAQLLERIRLHQDQGIGWIRDGGGDPSSEITLMGEYLHY
ncbi:MAG: hypothetical protein IPL46_23170 [Saprospiraceae bacterium]|nr:hypothetical protein [Saprospiraceae bacterium]